MTEGWSSKCKDYTSKRQYEFCQPTIIHIYYPQYKVRGSAKIGAYDVAMRNKKDDEIN